MSSECDHTNQPPTIRQVQVQDLDDVRNTIIEMLTDAPHAFAETLAEAHSRSTFDWQARVQRWAEGQEEVAFIASDASGICGFVWGSLKDEDHPNHSLPPDCVLVGKLWVDPRWRKTGLGPALMEEVHEWVKKIKARRSVLGVIEPNPKLVQYYKDLGYRDTGIKETVSPTDKRQTIVMVKVLSG